MTSPDYKIEIAMMEANSERHRVQFENELAELKKCSGGKYDKIIENCEKHVQLDRNIGKILRKFFDELVLCEYLRETKPLRMTAGVMYRNTITIDIIDRIGNPFLKNTHSRFYELLKEGKFGEYGFTVLYVTLLVHLWLDQTEYFKNMILTMLNDKARTECGITDKDTLGTLLNNLSKRIFVDDFRNVIKPDFRNALAHSKWWLQGSNFCYQDKNDDIVVLHKLEFTSLELHLVTLTLHFIAVLHEYFLMP